MDNKNYAEIVANYIDFTSDIEKKEMEYLYDLIEQSNDVIRSFVLFANYSYLDPINYGLTIPEIEKLAWGINTYNGWNL